MKDAVMEDAGEYRIKCVNRVGATTKDSKYMFLQISNFLKDSTAFVYGTQGLLSSHLGKMN